ncbi:hypothetical protein [Bacillus cereus group sp. BfR-BA-02730]|uniref:hypothetical protein n=1 Tax=Bacillus cereus group sp. BfR-BA-02730 TaxID=3094893 RepID=UPI0029C1092B|nr:hypothetical protein [Bacillus cereus group sp. BfR-BA-02730]MDX5808233.1 hypothetical protein [Bacillus cereus group sp. BfR-BA-02730]
MIAKKLYERASENSKEMTGKKYIDFLIRMAETRADKGAYVLTIELNREAIQYRNQITEELIREGFEISTKYLRHVRNECLDKFFVTLAWEKAEPTEPCHESIV